MIQEESISSETTFVVFDVNSLELPPWLISITPKRKKQEISPNILDFQQIMKLKPRVAKKEKTISWVVVDKNKMKYVEVEEPLVEKPPKEMQLSNYRLTGIECGKQTHSSLKHDAQDSVTSLVQSYDEILAKKDVLKEKNTQLITMIQKITNSSNQVDP